MTVRSFCAALLAILAVSILPGCASGSRRGDASCGCAPTCCPTGCGGLPTDLPKDPDPCLKYCKTWVPPVYRDVPSLEMTPGCLHSVDRKVMKTCFVEREVKPRECNYLTKENCPCDATAVEVCAGGWKWQEVGCDCWKYCYQPPSYKWCPKTVTEEKICYCAETPPEYETVAVHCPSTTCDVKYVPPTYNVVWNRECYRPGHYVWVPQDDACGSCQREPCTPRTYYVPTPKAGITKTCPRCN
jgi:hypothetical protein